jgi:hypothetical protein
MIEEAESEFLRLNLKREFRSPTSEKTGEMGFLFSDLKKRGTK